MLRPEALATSAVEVSHLYGFLGQFFREEISLDLLRLLRTPQMQAQLKEAEIDLDEPLLSSTDDTALLESLAVEYAALFLGPGGHINTHESVQAEKDGYLWGERTAAVRDFIENAGVKYSENFKGIPDHISVELEFMAMLARFEGDEWAAGNPERAANCLEYQREFLALHLGVWYGQFCEQIIDRAEFTLYRQMARLLRDFITGEIEDVSQRLMFANRLIQASAELEATSPTKLAICL